MLCLYPVSYPCYIFIAIKGADAQLLTSFVKVEKRSGNGPVRIRALATGATLLIANLDRLGPQRTFSGLGPLHHGRHARRRTSWRSASYR